MLPEQGLSRSEQDALGLAIAAVPGVAQSHFVSKSELLDFLRLRDPETARVALAFGENPVPEFFEVKPEEPVLASAAAWVQGSFRDGKVPGVADVLFKQGEADAVVYSSFCSKFMRLMLALSALALVLFCVFAEFSGTARRPGGLSSAGWVLSGMTGAAFAVFVAWAVVYPVRLPDRLVAGAVLALARRRGAVRRVYRQSTLQMVRLIPLFLHLSGWPACAAPDAAGVDVKKRELEQIQQRLEDRRRQLDEFRNKEKDLSRYISFSKCRKTRPVLKAGSWRAR